MRANARIAQTDSLHVTSYGAADIEPQLLSLGESLPSFAFIEIRSAFVSLLTCRCRRCRHRAGYVLLQGVPLSHRAPGIVQHLKPVVTAWSTGLGAQYTAAHQLIAPHSGMVNKHAQVRKGRQAVFLGNVNTLASPFPRLHLLR